AGALPFCPRSSSHGNRTKIFLPLHGTFFFRGAAGSGEGAIVGIGAGWTSRTVRSSPRQSGSSLGGTVGAPSSSCCDEFPFPIFTPVSPCSSFVDIVGRAESE